MKFCLMRLLNFDPAGNKNKCQDQHSMANVKIIEAIWQIQAKKHSKETMVFTANGALM